MTQRILNGDVIEQLRTLPNCSVQCCVTSPPYWGLRDYGKEGQIGLEPTPELYVAKMVEVFREVRRVLRDDGTLWLNLGDSYVHGVPGGGCVFANGRNQGDRKGYESDKARGREKVSTLHKGAKVKDLVGIPWMVAFALRADGWWLRQDIIWHKPNPMPESVTDRCTKAHEYVFLLAKSERYYYDAEAVKEDGSPNTVKGPKPFGRKEMLNGNGTGNMADGVEYECAAVRNRRSVWTITTQPYPEAHFATYPEDLVEPCIKAGSRIGSTVLDPFCGSGTTLLVARKLGRDGIGIELNDKYVELARQRIDAYAPLFGATA